MTTLLRTGFLLFCILLAACHTTPVPPDPLETVLERAQQGNAAAQYELGSRYNEGHGFPCDPTQAAHWFELAGKQGVVEAQFQLAILQAKGVGIPRDYRRAYVWLLVAATLAPQRRDISELLAGVEQRLFLDEKVSAKEEALRLLATMPGKKQ